MAVQTSTINGASEATIITAGTAGVNNILTGLIITTALATAGTLTFKDSTGGTTRFVVDYPNAAVAPNTPFIFFFPKDWPLYQAAPANNWTVTPSQAGVYHISAFYIEG
jgi:hypothetical protein